MSQFHFEGVTVAKVLTQHGAEWQCPLCYLLNTMRYKGCPGCGCHRIGRKHVLHKTGGGKPDTLTQEKIVDAIKIKTAAGEW